MRYLYFQPLLASQKALLASNKSFEASTQTTSLENELPQRPKVNLNNKNFVTKIVDSEFKNIV